MTRSGLSVIVTYELIRKAALRFGGMRDARLSGVRVLSASGGVDSNGELPSPAEPKHNVTSNGSASGSGGGLQAHFLPSLPGSLGKRPSRLEMRKNLMEFTAFTCQFCSEHPEWDTPDAADSAAVWHLFDAHPVRWLAVAGNDYPTGPATTAAGPRLIDA